MHGMLHLGHLWWNAWEIVWNDHLDGGNLCRLWTLQLLQLWHRPFGASKQVWSNGWKCKTENRHKKHTTEKMTYILTTCTLCILHAQILNVFIWYICMHLYIYTMYTCYLIDIHYIHSTRSHLGHLTLERGFKMFCVSFLLGSFSFVFKFLFGIEPFVSIESIEFLFRISCFESFLLALDCLARAPQPWNFLQHSETADGAVPRQASLGGVRF